jgi:DNA topoisomerase I
MRIAMAPRLLCSGLMRKPARQPRPPATTPVEPEAAARTAGLRYTVDARPGISRKKRGVAFRYIDSRGRLVRDESTLARIKTLAIPPAWTDVWICPLANGHLQATGRDQRGRKQYRYHARWRSVRDESKYARLIAFATALPSIRRRTARDLSHSGLSREKVLATVVRLLETTLIRVGNVEYARSNRSFGLTTMRDNHVTVMKATVRFQFRGKSGVRHEIDIEDARLAMIVARCRDLPGQELFQYVDPSGAVCDVGSGDVNEYLRSIAGEEFTAKDFRTWAGTVLAALALQEFESFDTKTQARRNVVRAIESVASRLGNTPSVCRKCYVHPAILEAYLDGSMVETLRQRAEEEMADVRHLKPEEAAVLALLQRRLASGEPPPLKLAKGTAKAAKSTSRRGSSRRPRIRVLAGMGKTRSSPGH